MVLIHPDPIPVMQILNNKIKHSRKNNNVDKKIAHIKQKTIPSKFHEQIGTHLVRLQSCDLYSGSSKFRTQLHLLWWGSKKISTSSSFHLSFPDFGDTSTGLSNGKMLPP